MITSLSSLLEQRIWGPGLNPLERHSHHVHIILEVRAFLNMVCQVGVGIALLCASPCLLLCLNCAGGDEYKNCN
jgi:hypothetical protein